MVSPPLAATRPCSTTGRMRVKLRGIMPARRRAFLLFCFVLLTTLGCAHHYDVTARRDPLDPPPPPPVAYHLHLNGIGGYRFIDKYMLVGLQDGGLTGEVHAYDWTGADVGLVALLASGRHREQSHEVAQMILAAPRAQPGRKITLSRPHPRRR